MGCSLKGEKNPFYGKKHTLEARAKMAASRLGSSVSPELKQKLSEIHNIKYNEKLAVGESRCIRCGEVKILSEFPNGRKRRDGQPRYAYCKLCHSAYQKELNLKRVFNLSVEENKKIDEFQNFVCAICKVPPKNPKKRRLAVDHRHSDGLIRGHLCWKCNRLLGLAGDNEQVLRNAVDYLLNPPATAALGTPHYGLPGRVGTKKQRKLIKKMKKLKNGLTSKPPHGSIPNGGNF